MKLYGTESNETIRKELGTRLRDARIAMSMTQEEMAKKAGVSLSTLNRMENGSNVRLDYLLNVFRALNVAGNLDLLLPSQEITPEDLFFERKKRKRASVRKKKAHKGDWKWGDET